MVNWSAACASVPQNGANLGLSHNGFEVGFSGFPSRGALPPAGLPCGVPPRIWAPLEASPHKRHLLDGKNAMDFVVVAISRGRLVNWNGGAAAN